MNIKYPAFLENKLQKNQEMRSCIDATTVDFNFWLKDSKLPFFPDYTDHGPDHLVEVLDTSVSLIHRSCKNLLTPEDAAVLILAVLLHDAALHISEAGFEDLIRGGASKNRITDFDTTFWPDLWQEFLFAAKHWDDRKLIDVFGEAEPGVPLASVRDPFQSYRDLSESDRKLIGEFIRQNHPRMAHEFAIFGVPGPSDAPLRPNQRFGSDKLDIAGLVARSHGLPLRSSLDYLNRRYHRREYQNIHAVFLMALLRVSDYLQIQSNRASPVAPRYKRITSPVSRLQHDIHHAVRSTTFSNEDPESIEIVVEPKNVYTFLGLKDLFRSIQEELDISWAVLGEVYGSDRKLSKLGLSIRRVRSNLESSYFAERSSYFPGRVELTVANSELIKLLVRPLYGNRPEIGIRELLQNSVDAVLELKAWLSNHPEMQSVNLVSQEGDVEILLNETDLDRSLVVSDRGIGMTEKVISDYFLRAGASYRNSLAWQKEFESIDEDHTPRAQVLRSGRFGIGALAAFLLGEEIEVSTRHVTATRGITFKTKLDGGPIELRYHKEQEVGTVIKIKLEPSVYLSDDGWDWYCFGIPRVIRRKHKEVSTRTLPQKLNLPQDPHNLPVGWYEVHAPEFDSVFVGLSEVKNQGSLLICNGIKIGEGANLRSSWFVLGDGEFKLAAPATVVLDPDAKLPLDVRRTTLVGEPSFVEEIEKVASESLLAGMLLNIPERGPLGSELNYLLPRFRRSWEEMVSFSPWMETPAGVALASAWSLSQLGSNSVLLIFEGFPLHHSAQCFQEGSFIYGDDDQIDALFSGGVFDHLPLRGVRLLTATPYGEHLLELASEDRFFIASPLELEWTNGAWSLLSWGQCQKSSIDNERLPIPTDRASIWPVAVEWYFDTSKDHGQELQGLTLHWQRIIRRPIIPFDLNLRHEDLPHAYEILEHYFEEHKNLSQLSSHAFVQDDGLEDEDL